MESLGIGTMLLSAFTGAATTQLTDAVTLLTMLSFGLEVGYQQKDYEQVLTREIVERFEQFADRKRLMMLVIDECSFINPEILHHVDMRLRALLECNVPFGGIVLILAGAPRG